MATQAMMRYMAAGVMTRFMVAQIPIQSMAIRAMTYYMANVAAIR